MAKPQSALSANKVKIEAKLIGFQTGVRESAQSWRELLIDIKRRGLEVAPDLAVGDGALGFWKAIGEVFPGTRHQRCWVHKTSNVLNKVALSVQVDMKADLREIYEASTRAAAGAAIDVFADKYGPKYGKAVACLTKDREALPPSSTSRPSTGTICARHTRSRACSPRPVIGRCGRKDPCRDDCQVDGVQARHRGRKNLATTEGRKSVVESRPRNQIPKRHRGHPNTGSPRRLIDLVTQSSRLARGVRGAASAESSDLRKDYRTLSFQ
jgi:hypothetical protein